MVVRKLALVALMEAVVLAGCGGPAGSSEESTDVSDESVAVNGTVQVVASVSPATAQVTTSGTVQLSATVSGTTNTSVSWTVQEAAAGGSVSSTGLYTPPSSAGTYHVVATSQVDSTKAATSTITVTAPAPTPVDPTLRTVAAWESLFLGTWNSEDAGTAPASGFGASAYNSRSRSANSLQFYNLAYGVDGLVAMFEATGKTQYLDRVLGYVENMIGTATPASSRSASQFNDSYRGWGATDPTGDQGITKGYEYPLYECYCWRYVTRMLRVMHDNPAVYGNSSYRTRYDAILAFTKTHMFDKWYSRGTVNLYRQNTHMASHWAYISADLWYLTGETKFRTVVDNMNLHIPNYSNNSFRGQMRLHASDSTAYDWSSTWGDLKGHQDSNHGNGVISYIVEANMLGIEWTATDMRRFQKTLENHIWKPGGGYGASVDGSGSGSGWLNDGFCKLGRYSSTIQKKLETYTIGRNMQLYGNGALNAKILNGR